MNKEEITNLLFKEVNAIIEVYLKGAELSYNKYLKKWRVSARFGIVKSISVEELLNKFKNTGLNVRFRSKTPNVFSLVKAYNDLHPQ